ncbi:NAD-dependent epimerase/dehydratase family protein [Flavobacterium sp. FlaQc-47]|uniref:NAD-dependent epimerase/dehydratase family protein n=1 Tax=Flavobacterium sp. FlaQc-47 TaxID=3374180 RepID=UPI00375670F6
MQVKENILLLGGTGFIGKNIIEYFISHTDSLNYQLIVLSRYNQISEHKDVVYELGDYGDKEVLKKLFSRWDFKKVFHLASSSIPVSSNQNIHNDINGNLISTIGLLEVMKEYRCNFILYLSSGGAVYGEKRVPVISEDTSCTPISSYGIIKLAIENYLKLYQRHYGINYLILRISNPFGPYHNSEEQGVINVAVRRAVNGKSLEVWGDGSQSKDYIFIYDLVKIVFQFIRNEIVNKVVNVGSGETHQLNSILDRIKVYIPNFEIKYVESKPTDIKDFCLDISLLKSLIDFEFTDFDLAIEKTIEWEEQKITI